MPPRGIVADFPPVFAGRGRGSPALRRVLRPRRRILAAGLALAAAGTALTAARTQPPAAASPDGPSTGVAEQSAGQSRPEPAPASGRRPVSAPVRIADPAAVELLRAGDRVDVIAAGAVRGASGGTSDGRPVEARLVARRALVERVPDRDAEPVSTSLPRGALIVLSVSRRTATELAGASAVSPLTVTLC